MNILGLTILVGMFGIFLVVFSLLLLKVVNRVTETNKQLLIIVAGKGEKPESALRALVASQKSPWGKLRGIAVEEKKDEKLKNSNYTMKIGLPS